MTIIQKSILWAAIIIAATLLATGLGMSDSASFAVVMGLTGAAYASIYSGKGCTGSQKCSL